MVFQIISSVIGIIGILFVAYKVVDGQSKAKGRLEIDLEWKASIDKQLNNHIISLDKKLDTIIETHTGCRKEMGERVAKVEGKLNGKV